MDIDYSIFERFKYDPSLFIKIALMTDMSNKQMEFVEATKTRNHVVNIFSRQTGKSTIMARFIVHRFLYGEGKVVNGERIKENILVFAPIKEQTTNMFNKVKQVIERFPVVMSFITKMNSEIIQAKNGNQIKFMSASPGSHIRGATATCIVIDETQDITDEKYSEDIMPMGSTTNALIIESGTPKSKNHFWRTINDPMVKVIRQLWFECSFISKEFIDEQKRKMLDGQFRQEYMCEFVEEGVMAFPSRLLQLGKTIQDYNCYTELSQIPIDAGDREWEQQKLQDKNAPKPVYAIGVDVGRQNDNTVVCVTNVTHRPAKLAAVVEFNLDTPYEQLVGHIAYLCKAYEPTHYNQDYTNEKAFVEMLQAKGVPIAVTPENTHGAIAFTNKNKTEMVNNARLGLEKEKIVLPSHVEKLQSQMLNQQYEYDDATKKYKYYHPSTEHDDVLWAFLLSIKNVSMEDFGEGQNESTSADHWKTYNEKVHGTQDKKTGEILSVVSNLGIRLKDRERLHPSRWHDVG
jgi:hypothetical protein